MICLKMVRKNRKNQMEKIEELSNGLIFIKLSRWSAELENKSILKVHQSEQSTG